MKLIDILKESLKEDNSSKYQDALNQLLDLASNGEIDNKDIENISTQLLSARRKMFASRKSPEQRAASAEKGKLTKELRKIRDKANSEAANQLGIKDNTTKFALNINMYKGEKTQKKFNSIVKDLIPKYAAEAGITDQAAIEDALSWYQDIDRKKFK